jgi:HEAT repeat protein
MKTNLVLCLAFMLPAPLGARPASGPLVRTRGDPAAADLVGAFERSRAFWQQFQTAEKIAALHNTRVLPRLPNCLTNEDRHVRGNAAFVFAALGDERGFEVLGRILADRSARPKGQGLASIENPWSVRK